MTAIQNLTILNVPRGSEILPPYQILYNALVEGWDRALVKTLLVTHVYDVEFPRADTAKIAQLFELMPRKLGLNQATKDYIESCEPTYSNLRQVLFMLDVQDIFALGW